MEMMRRLLLGSLLLGAIGLLVSSLPDIARYLKIRQM
jgi:hypothetical protein